MTDLSPETVDKRWSIILPELAVDMTFNIANVDMPFYYDE